MNKAKLILFTICAFIAIPSIALAATDPPADPTGPIDLGDTVASVKLSASTVTFLVATLIPIAVGLLTKLGSKYKGPLMLVLNALNAGITTWQLADGTAIISQQAFHTFITGLVGSFAMYYGVWKPLGVTSSAVQVAGPAPGESTMVPGKLANKGLQ